VGGLRAADLTQRGAKALAPAQSLADAVATMADERLKSMPVIDDDGRVVGMLSETDVLRWLGAATFAELLHRPPQRLAQVDALLQGADVGSVMVSPAVTVEAQAAFAEVMQAFRRHTGRRMPVVDADGRLVGVLARKDFIAACPLGVAAA
jgi:CBS-domain-containing membrane protein